MLTKDNAYRIMTLFFDSPEKAFHIREIARLARLSAPGVLKLVRKLKAEGLLVSKKGKVFDEVRSSKAWNFILLKKCHSVQRLFETGLVDFLRDSYEEPEAIVLFGSCSKGEDISTSDIDIAVVTKKKAEIDLKKFEKSLKKKISVYEVQTKTAEKAFLNELANGAVLYGYLKVV